MGIRTGCPNNSCVSEEQLTSAIQMANFWKKTKLKSVEKKNLSTETDLSSRITLARHCLLHG